MKKILISLFCCAAVVAQAQDIYKIQNLSTEDLVGTARYVGMGGAMNILGADLSTMVTNPAGIGLYRRSDAAISFGLITNHHAEKFNDIGHNRLSFDQVGFVYSSQFNNSDSGLQFLNFGFNYQKRRNFKSFAGLNQIEMPDHLSQAITFANLGQFYWDGHSGITDKDALIFDIPLLDAANKSFMVDPVISDKTISNWWDKEHPVQAKDYTYKKEWHGGIQEYDFTVGMNFGNQFFLGGGLGIYNVNYNNGLYYQENLIDNSNNSLHNYNTLSVEEIRGTGFDFKLGTIWRPIEDDPFRIGLSFSSPMWCTLSARNEVKMESPFVKEGSKESYTIAGYAAPEYDFALRTPWKINIGVASTIANCIAIDAEYEYKHQGATSLRFPKNNIFDATDAYWINSKSDHAMNKQLDNYLKGIHTFKIGIEELLTPEWSLRFGYNYISSPFEKNAFRNLYPNLETNYADSPSIYGLTSTDYVNLGDTHRGTIGVGYHRRHFYIDAAYLYQTQEAHIYPFHDAKFYENPSELTAYSMQPVSTHLRQNRFLLTLGYKF